MISGENIMRLKYKEIYGHEGICDLKKYNNIVICTHENECAATSVKGSAESLMNYVIGRYDLDASNLIWVTCDHWRKKDQYRQISFSYIDGKCSIKGNKVITAEELNDMVRKSGDYIM